MPNQTWTRTRIAGSYALLKVFLWALPILGFIGTVLGLSVAMSGFGATDLTDINALKGAVGSITSGLSSAFNNHPARSALEHAPDLPHERHAEA